MFNTDYDIMQDDRYSEDLNLEDREEIEDCLEYAITDEDKEILLKRDFEASCRAHEILEEIDDGTYFDDE